MTHKLIKTDNYLLVVDDSEIKNGDWIFSNEGSVNPTFLDGKFFSKEHLKAIWLKIISHLPLNDSPILQGVDLLPPQEDGVEKAEKAFTEVLDSETKQVYDKMLLDATEHGFIIGYNKAKEKYKYTEEDVRKAITMARELEDWWNIVFEYDNNDIIQSLHQYPTEFETVDEYPVITDDDYFLKEEKSTPRPKTITTAQGIQWVGKYK